MRRNRRCMSMYQANGRRDEAGSLQDRDREHKVTTFQRLFIHNILCTLGW